MSTAEHETERPPVNLDVEIRIRDFGNFMVLALRNFTIIFILAAMLWYSVKLVPSTIPVPFSLPIPMQLLLRWVCVMCLYLVTIGRNARLFHSIIAITRVLMSKIEDEQHSQNQDMGTRTNNLEDWILANFCVIIGLSTIYFVASYWIEVISLTLRSFFYWTCTAGGLCLLLWLLKRTIRFYRKVKGLKHEEIWDILAGVYVLRLYHKFEEFEKNGVLEQCLNVCRLLSEIPKSVLLVIGFYRGEGPLFDRLPDDVKAERRRCKTWEDVANFFAVCAGPPDEEGGDKEDSKNRKDVDEVGFPPSVFEFQPNPWIFRHLREEPPPSLDSGPSTVQDTLDCHISNTTETDETDETFFSDMAVDFHDESISKNDQKFPSAPSHAGPATMFVTLSSFTCSQCSFVANSKSKLKHITRSHNHQFKCDHNGCGVTFGLRTNLERHEVTHTGEKAFTCPNSWCSPPGKMFAREDNLKRHMKKCGTSK